jgi:hypothetical protein
MISHARRILVWASTAVKFPVILLLKVAWNRKTFAANMGHPRASREVYLVYIMSSQYFSLTAHIHCLDKIIIIIIFIIFWSL